MTTFNQEARLRLKFIVNLIYAHLTVDVLDVSDLVLRFLV